MEKMNTSDHVEQVISSLSALILTNLVGGAHHQYFPSGNPDDDDERIKQGKKKAAILRKIREDFENVASGILE